jgi:hypothetical protein
MLLAPRPAVPSRKIVPAIVTSPVASIVTGVFAAFGVNATSTPAGILMVV